MDYVNQSYWDKSYENFDIDIDVTNDPITALLKSYLPVVNSYKTVLEIGCFPGRYLRAFGDFGYTLNGIDTTPNTKDLLPNFLKNKGYSLGKFYCEDILNNTIDEKFDVVCSFGFIEHFSNWKNVIDVHLKYLKPGGILILTVPNFSGFVQKVFHTFFDNRNLKRHNLNAMNINGWERHINLSGDNYTTLFKGCFGEIEFWADERQANKTKISLLRKWTYFFNKKRFNKISDLYSPYKGFIIKYD